MQTTTTQPTTPAPIKVKKPRAPKATKAKATPTPAPAPVTTLPPLPDYLVKAGRAMINAQFARDHARQTAKATQALLDAVELTAKQTERAAARAEDAYTQAVNDAKATNLYGI
jgi:hypothetical protein